MAAEDFDALAPMASHDELYGGAYDDEGLADIHERDLFPEPNVVARTNGHKPDQELRLTPAASVQIDRAYWVWDRRIPVGGTTLMPGREGLGKTALVCWLMARLTRGQLPGQWWKRPAEVVYIGTEDDRASVLVPRLTAAGADLDKVHFVDMAEGMTFSVSVDCTALARALAGRTVALVVVDPLDGHLVGTDTHRKSDVQQAVAKLAVLAQEVRCGALGLAHLNKGDTRELLGRVVGSVGFTTSVRSVLGVGEHPDNPAERVCVVGKANMTDKATIPAVKFKVEKAFIDHPDGGDPIDTGLAVMLGEEDGIDPNAVIDSGSVAEKTSRDMCVEWLNDVLADGPQSAALVKKWAKAAEFSEPTLHRARRKAGVEVTRNNSEQGRPSLWALKGYVSRGFVSTPHETKDEPPLTRDNAPDEGVTCQPPGSDTKPSPVPTERDCECGRLLITATDHQTGRCVFCHHNEEMTQ
jgi:hypothetical protein